MMMLTSSNSEICFARHMDLQVKGNKVDKSTAVKGDQVLSLLEVVVGDVLWDTMTNVDKHTRTLLTGCIVIPFLI